MKTTQPQDDFEAYRDEWLQDVRQASSPTEKGRRFARKLIQQWRELGDEFDSDETFYYCDGANDGGVDIAFLERGESSGADGDTWFVVQSKYGKAFAGSGTIVEEGQKLISTLDGERSRLSSLSQEVVERLRVFRRDASEQDRLVLVLATDIALGDARRKALDDMRAIGQQRFGDLFEVVAISIETIYDQNRERRPARNRLRLPFPLRAPEVLSAPKTSRRVESEMLVGTVSLWDFYEFARTYRNLKNGDLDALFEKNVRRFLKTGKVNKKIADTLLKTPEQFGLFNNGVTIVVEEMSLAEGELLLTEPSIVNGCQTTSTICKVCDAQLGSGGTAANSARELFRQQLQRAPLVIKVVRVRPDAAGEQLLSDISLYTNSQNAVRGKDFIALRNSFRVWQSEMRASHNIFLELQRGSWEAESNKAKRRSKKAQPLWRGHANAFDLLKIYGAGWLNEPGPAWNNNAAFLPPDGDIFKRITADENSFGVDDLLACYLLQQAIIPYKFAHRAEKAERKLSKFLFYRVVLELLRRICDKEELPTSRHELSRALNVLLQPPNEALAKQLLDASVRVIDRYMSENDTYSATTEPAYEGNFNAYLKAAELAKDGVKYPALWQLFDTISESLILNDTTQRIADAIQK